MTTTSERIVLTTEGAGRLRQVLNQYETVDKPQIIKAIADARALGDLKENAEYHAAKDQQGLLEAKINDLRSALAKATVVDVATLPKDGKVRFGSKVTVVDTEDAKQNKQTFRLVGSHEVQPDSDDLSFESPLGKALIGYQKGEKVRFTVPSGTREYEIQSVD